MKKIGVLILTVILLAVCFALSVSAAAPTITISSANAAPGGTVTVNVSLNNNPGINSFSLGFSYDATQLTLKEVKAAPELGGQFSYAKKAVWLNSADSKYNGNILFLTFDVAASAKGVVKVTVTYEEGEIINYNEDDVDFTIVPGTITVKQPECSHQWDAGKVTKAATCKDTGVKTYTCSVCKTTKTDTIAKTNNHTWDTGKVTKAATCKETGIKTYTCSVCKTTKTENIAINPNNHAEYGKEVKNAKAATTTAKGYTGDTVCKGCGVILEKGKEIPMLPSGHVHNLVKTEAKAPSCVATGNTAYYTCSGCGKLFHDAQGKDEIADVSLVLLSAVGHSYGEWTINRPATAEKEGEKVRVCTVCGAKETALIPKTADDPPDDGTLQFSLKKVSLVDDTLRVAISWKNGKGMIDGGVSVIYDPNVLQPYSSSDNDMEYLGADAARIYDPDDIINTSFNFAVNSEGLDYTSQAGWYFYDQCDTDDTFEVLILTYTVTNPEAASTEFTLRTRARFNFDDEEITGEKTFTIQLNGEDQSGPIPTFTLGDVDGNGKVESSDARLALRAAVHLSNEPTDVTEGTVGYKAADYDGNGKVESSDARCILRVSVKLDPFG